MATFHVVAYSFPHMILTMTLDMVTGEETDEKFKFFKSRTLVVKYLNEPVVNLSGQTVELADLEGDWLLLAPMDGLQNLSSLGAGLQFKAAVQLASMEDIQPIFRYIHANWDDLNH